MFILADYMHASQLFFNILYFHRKMPETAYDCQTCTGYCCAYPIIQVNRDDVSRLAKHLGLTATDVRNEYTVLESPKVTRLKLTPDKVFNSESCVFLDKETRFCTVYESRPNICREHPGNRCEWYDRMLIEQSMSKGQKVILLREMPWTIDADHPFYDNDKVTGLLQSYAGNGTGKN